MTTISYNLRNNILVNITIYDLKGKKVKTLVNTFQYSGNNSITWNATNTFGQSVATGMYFYVFQSGEHTFSRKMLFIK